MISKGCLVRYPGHLDEYCRSRQGVYLTISDTYLFQRHGLDIRMVDIVLDGKTRRADTKLLEKVQ
jgi:hypothetical protein